MKKGTSTKPEVFIALAQAYENGNTIITDRVESILTPNAAALPDELQDALDRIGDSPIAEPELFSALEKGIDEFATQCGKRVATEQEFDGLAIAVFIGRVRTKILTDVDTDGVFKTTPNIDNMRLPTFADIRAFGETVKNVPENEAEKIVLKMLGLTNVKLTKWETELVKSIVVAYAQCTTDAMLGKVTDRTPFARYLKNI